MSGEEVALDHYLLSKHNEGRRQGFFQQVYDSVGDDLHIQSMAGMGAWQGWTFVDYCHFTAQANMKIARELADYIAADGKIRIFK